MTDIMRIVSNLMIIVGGIAFFSSAFLRTPEAPPFASPNPKHWKPIWSAKTRTYFRPPGYALMVGGWAAMAAGIMLHWIFVGWPW